MNGTHCTEEEIFALIDGNLPPLGTAAARRHLGLCPSCNARYRVLMGFERAVRNLPLARTGEGFTEAVMARLDPSLPAPRAFRFIAWIAYQAGLLLVVAVVTGVFILTGLIRPEEVEAGKSIAGEAAGLLDIVVSSATTLLEGWMRSAGPVLSGGSSAVLAGTILVLAMLLLLDRNFSKKPLHRAR